MNKWNTPNSSATTDRLLSVCPIPGTMWTKCGLPSLISKPQRVDSCKPLWLRRMWRKVTGWMSRSTASCDFCLKVFLAVGKRLDKRNSQLGGGWPARDTRYGQESGEREGHHGDAEMRRIWSRCTCVCITSLCSLRASSLVVNQTKVFKCREKFPYHSSPRLRGKPGPFEGDVVLPMEVTWPGRVVILLWEENANMVNFPILVSFHEVVREPKGQMFGRWKLGFFFSPT